MYAYINTTATCPPADVYKFTNNRVLEDWDYIMIPLPEIIDNEEDMYFHYIDKISVIVRNMELMEFPAGIIGYISLANVDDSLFVRTPDKYIWLRYYVQIYVGNADCTTISFDVPIHLIILADAMLCCDFSPDVQKRDIIITKLLTEIMDKRISYYSSTRAAIIGSEYFIGDEWSKDFLRHVIFEMILNKLGDAIYEHPVK